MYLPILLVAEIPAAILQEKFFNNDRPQYMNYGAIGFVVGHEMTHGFDNDGSSFDKQGLSKNWWNSETKEKYSKKTMCMIHQYDDYTAESVDLKVSPFPTECFFNSKFIAIYNS